MSKFTLQTQLVRGLERLGYRHAARDTTRYVVFVDHVRDAAQGDGHRLFVGRAGALRSGRTVEGSIPLLRLKSRALNAGLPEKETPNVDR